jgi:hypothetical protein
LKRVTVYSSVDRTDKCQESHLNRGYDSETNHRHLKGQSLTTAISKRVKPTPLAATRRWIVERPNSAHNTNRTWWVAPRGEGKSSTSESQFSRGSSGAELCESIGTIPLEDSTFS